MTQLSRLPLLQALFDGARDAIVVVGDDGAFIDLNPAACALFGMPHDELLGRRADDFAEPGFETEAVRRAYRERGYGTGEFRLLRADGQRRVVEYNASANIAPGWHMAVMRDVTDARRERERVHAAAQRLQAVVEHAPLVIWATDAHGAFTLCEGRAIVADHPDSVDVIGRHVSEVLGARPLRLSSGESLPAAEMVARVLRGELVEGATELAGRLFETRCMPLSAHGGEIQGVLGVSVDVSETRDARRALERAQRLEPLGRLAGGIAHDFNNMLAAISGFASVIASELRADDPLRSDVDEILEASRRAATLTRQLLAFGRKQALEPRQLELSDVVAGLEKLLRRVIGEDIELSSECAASLPTVYADPGQLEQVLMNLAVNARDAMPGGGRLRIGLRVVHVGAELAATLELSAGEYVCVSVEDDGIGMDAATRERLFEPFFTTKGPGAGTGLGLATAYGIVRQSGGAIAVTSAPGQGARFDIYLPPGAGPQPQLDTPPATMAARGADETILLVEDDDLVRRVTRRLLERAGYRVVAARDGEEALALFRRERPDLVITDVVMPRMGGAALARELASVAPGLHVLFMSAYPDERYAAELRDAPMLRKPFTPDSLLASVRRALDERPRGPR